MARTKQGAALTDLHRLQQLQLRAAVVRDVAKLWPLWDPGDPASYEAFETAMALLVQSRSQESAVLAARYYEMFRELDAPGAAVKQAVQIAASRTASEIRAAISATSRASVYAALSAGQPYATAMANGLVHVSGAASREVLNAGRDTIRTAVMNDHRALGWARVTGGGACAFCAMLASRGPVYGKSSGDFQAHDHCSCFLEPVYQGSEWPGRAREFQRRWAESDGTLNGFRRALNKRPDKVTA